MVSDGLNWSTETMRNSAEAWSLADDVCLRDFLESFGTKLDENIRQVLDSLGKLEDRIEASSIHLGNVTNRLGLLSSTQFVESRVAEDDDLTGQFEDTSEVKPDPNSEEVFCAKVGWALNNGNSFIEGAFVTVDFDQSDSEDDDVLQDLEPVYESRSSYHLRRLPHIIGTEKFMSETNVGLGTSSDEKEETSALSDSEDSDNEGLQDHKIDVVPEQVSDYSISDQDSDDELEIRKSNPKPSPRQPNIGSSVLVVSNDERENFLDERKQNEVGPQKANFADELASKIGATKKADPKPRRGIFSSDSDEDDGIFSATVPPLKRETNHIEKVVPPTKIPATTSAPPKLDEPIKPSNPVVKPRQSSLLPQSKPTKNNKDSTTEAIPSNPGKVKRERSIFSTDSSSDGEDHSTGTVVPIASKVEEKVTLNDEAKRVDGKVAKSISTRSSKLFGSDSDDDELFNPKAKPTTTPAVIKSSNDGEKLLKKDPVLEAVKSKGSEPQEKVIVARKKASIFDDSSSEDEIDELFKAVTRPARTQLKNRAEETKIASKRPTIFSDSDSDVANPPDQSSPASRTKSEDHFHPKIKTGTSPVSEKQDPPSLPDDGQKIESLTDDSSHERSMLMNVTDHETSANDDVDGNVMSARSSQFKDILNSKMAKGPKLFGRKKKSVNLVSDDTGTSSENLEPPPLQVQSHHDISSVERIGPMKQSASDSNLILREPHQPIDSEDSVVTDKEVKVLKSLTKARAGRPPNRRGPTRKALKDMAQDTSDGLRNTVSDSRTETSEYEDTSLPSSFQAQSLLASQKSKVVDPQPLESSSNKQPGDTFPPKTPLQTDQTQPSSSVVSKPESDDDDIFGPPPMPDTIKSARDPLFGTPSSDEDDLFSSSKGPQNKKSTTGSSLFDDLGSDDDLFA